MFLGWSNREVGWGLRSGNVVKSGEILKLIICVKMMANNKIRIKQISNVDVYSKFKFCVIENPNFSFLFTS